MKTRIEKAVKDVRSELKKIITRVKATQVKFQDLLKSQDWMDEARKYAERQSKEVKKLLSSDVSRVKSFLERERKELEKFQKQIPGEVKKFRSFVKSQRKELEKLLAGVYKVNGTLSAKGKKKSSRTKPAGGAGKKKTAASRKSASKAEVTAQP